MTVLDHNPTPPVVRDPVANPWPQWTRVHRKSPAHEEGVVESWATQTVCFVGDEQGRVTHVRVRTVERTFDETGLRSFRPVEGSERDLPADLVLLATGFVGHRRGRPARRGRGRRGRRARHRRGRRPLGDQRRRRLRLRRRDPGREPRGVGHRRRAGLRGRRRRRRPRQHPAARPRGPARPLAVRRPGRPGRAVPGPRAAGRARRQPGRAGADRRAPRRPAGLPAALAAPAAGPAEHRALAGVLLVSGVGHLVRPAPFDSIVPRWLPPSRRFWTVASGLAEIGIGLLLVRPQTRRAGGLAAAGLFVAVFPGNLWMAWLWRRKPLAVPWSGRSPRLPLQLPLVAWGLRVARAAAPRG